MTTLVEPDDRQKRRPMPVVTGRFASVRADLMPDEILSARQTDVVRRRVILALAALVAVAIAAYGASWLQTNSARSDLSDATHRNAALAQQETQYAPLARAQNDAAAAKKKLATLTTGDLPWKTMLVALRSKAPTGLSLTNVTGAITATAASGAGATSAVASDPLNTTGKASSGALTLAGSARDSKSVAAYSDALGTITGLSSVLVTSVSGTADGVTFTLTATITGGALGGRFAATTKSGR